jgi:hypothetical protein
LTEAEFAIGASVVDLAAGLLCGGLASPRGRVGPVLATMLAFTVLCTWSAVYQMVLLGDPLHKAVAWTVLYSLVYFLFSLPAGAIAKSLLWLRRRKAPRSSANEPDSPDR